VADSQPKLGTVAWVDLTVADAPKVRDFYQKVIGWVPSPVKMGDYDDYNMVSPATEKPAFVIPPAR
jgi:predicted enzyme related to lactoylglutathione lyase